MDFFSKFEDKMEDTLEGAADRMINSPISPVQIAKKAEKRMRREKMVGAGKQYAPTLYTVLVNPDDDERLFGYYPTLAGETETYLAARAAEEGLVMDGQPLVRFIVDEGLHHGKFDVIAELVAAPLIAQLREEEMQRYGLGNVSGPYNSAAGMAGAAAADVGYAGAAGHVAGADYAEAGGKPPLPYVPEDEIDYSIDYGEYTFDSQDFEDYRENGSIGTPIPGGAYDPQAQPDHNAAYDAKTSDAAFYQNIDTPYEVDTPYGANRGTMARVETTGAAANQAGSPNAVPHTVVFAAGAGAATAQPNANIVRAQLIDTTNERTYTLATARLLIGRESSCDITLPDINASRTHAELRFEPQGVWALTDLGSTNGTFVNGRKISTCILRAGDRITMGMTNLVFDLA